MNFRLVLTLALASCFSAPLLADPVQRVPVPDANDKGAYLPQPAHKPLPQEVTGQPLPGQQPQGQPAQPGQPGAQQPQPGAPNLAQMASASNALPEEETFVQNYANRRSPRIMIFVNRTLQGDALPKEALEERLRIEEKQSATGALKVHSESVATTQKSGNFAEAGFGNSAAGNVHINQTAVDKNSFETSGPAEYSRSTSIKVTPGKLDEIGATRADYEMLEASLVDYFICGGRVKIYDSEMARAKLDREKVLRIENSDPAAIRLLNTELQTDVLIQVKAVPTTHSQYGRAVRLLAKTISTTDGRILANSFVDMPLPMTKTNINLFTRYLTQKMMHKLIAVWSGNPTWDPIEVRIYKLSKVDEGLLIRKFLRKTSGVIGVNTQGATGSTSTGYIVLSVQYGGAPEDLYEAILENLKFSKGLKAVDVTNNTINLEIVGPMDIKVIQVVMDPQTKQPLLDPQTNQPKMTVVSITLGPDSTDTKSEDASTGTVTGSGASPAASPVSDPLRPGLPSK